MQEITNIIQAFHAPNPTSIRKADENSFTPTFVAVGSMNVSAVHKLIELGVAEDLASYMKFDAARAAGYNYDVRPRVRRDVVTR